MVSEIREVSPFTKICMHNWGELIVTQGEKEDLVVEADEEFAEKVSTSVEDGVLILGVGRKWSQMVKNAFETSLSRQKVIYRCTVKELESIEIPGAARLRVETLSATDFRLFLGGAGDAVIATLDSDSLDVEMPGAGRLEVGGKVRLQEVIMSGAGSYDASKLESEKTSVELRGVGKVTVRVSDELKASIRGLGAIEYYGDPTVEKSISGLGTIKKIPS